MKRTNVILDEKLLSEAVELSGERTYSGAINRALDDMVRKLKVTRFVERMANGPDPFYPGYAEELYGEKWVRKVRKKLGKQRLTAKRRSPVAAMKVTAPKKRRGSRR